MANLVLPQIDNLFGRSSRHANHLIGTRWYRMTGSERLSTAASNKLYSARYKTTRPDTLELKGIAYERSVLINPPIWKHMFGRK